MSASVRRAAIRLHIHWDGAARVVTSHGPAIGSGTCSLEECCGS
jgi:hypothetical protein